MPIGLYSLELVNAGINRRMYPTKDEIGIINYDDPEYCMAVHYFLLLIAFLCAALL